MPGKKGQHQDFAFNFGGDGKVPNADLIRAVQSQLGHLVGKSSGYLESLPKSVQERIAVLKKYQADKEKVDDEFQTELKALQSKYDQRFQPLFEKREKIVSGDVLPTPEELEAAKKHLPELAAGQKAEEKSGEKGIPQFWLQVLLNSELAEAITEKDVEVLKHLVNITSKTVGDGPSFEIVFTFSPNPFFSETVLRKVYNGSEEEEMSVEPAKITWAAGKNPCLEKVTKQTKGNNKKGRGGKQGGAKSVTVEQPCESFFYFFDPESTPAEIFENEETDPDEDINEYIMDQDYHYGSLLKDQIIPDAVLYFTGEAEVESFEGEEYEEGEEEEGEGESDDEGDFDPSAAPPQKPEDCKQQ